MINDIVRAVGGRPVLGALLAGTLALAADGVAAAPVEQPAAQAGGVCEVVFSRISDVTYNPTLDLSGPIIVGSHSYVPETRTGGAGSTGFEVLDNDGFLTLVILLNEWRASGQLKRNESGTVAFQRSDLVLALDAVDRGLRYHQVLSDYTDANRPENYADVRRLLMLKLEGLRVLAEGLRPRLAGGAATVQLPPGLLSARRGLFLDRLAVGPEQLIQAQYLDRPTGDAQNVLCDGTAKSAFLGQVLCGYRFADGKAREPAICPEGLTFNRLAVVPRCRRVGGQDTCPDGS